MNAGDRIMPELILLGAGGHAKVLLALARAAGYVVKGVCDPELASSGAAVWQGIPVLGDDSVLDGIGSEKIGLINGIGQVVGGSARRRLFERLCERGFYFPALVHPAAWVAPGTELGNGVQIMAGAIVQPGCAIGDNSIVNTRASVDHDCWIGAHAHVAPGAILCGGVVVGNHVFVGSGATVIQCVQIGERAVVGAGVALVRNLEEGGKVIGASVRKCNAV